MHELLVATGLSGVFMARGFVPAFVIALLLRFGADVGLDPALVVDLQDAAGSVGVAPSWFTSDWMLLILGVLACMEVGAYKSPELRSAMGAVDRYIKPAMAALTYLGLMSTGDAGYLQSTYEQSQQAGMLSMMVLGGLVVATWVGASARAMLWSMVEDLDPDDSFGLMRAVSVLGDAWAVLGALLVVLLPIVVALLVVLIFACLHWVRARARRRDEATRRACARCGELVYGCAPVCFKCGAEQPEVRDVNWLGVSVDRPAHQPTHEELLVSVGRCPRCAERIGRQAGVGQGCGCCGHVAFAEPGFVESYDAFLRLRMVSTLLVCGVVGLVPVVGMALGIVIYKVHLVGAYRRYIGRGSGVLARWGLRALLLLAVFVQLVPVAGTMAVVGMALVSTLVYRGLWRRRVRTIGAEA